MAYGLYEVLPGKIYQVRGFGLAPYEFDGSVSVSHWCGVGIKHKCFNIVPGQSLQKLHQRVDLCFA